MAQGHEHVDDELAILVAELGEQATGLDEVEVGLGRFLLARAGQRVGAVVVLARVLELVPVGHDDGGAARVVQFMLRLPHGPVLQVGIGLDVVAAFLVTGGGLVAEAAHQVVEGVPQRLDADGSKVNLHVVSLRVPGGAWFLFELAARGLAQAPLLLIFCGGFIGEELHLVVRAEVIEGVGVEDHLHVDLRLADGEVELHEPVLAQLAHPHELAHGVELALPGRPRGARMC